MYKAEHATRVCPSQPVMNIVIAMDVLADEKS